MLARWPIREKLLVGLALLVVIVIALAVSGFVGLYSYRALVRSISWRVSELPLATELNKRVGDLRVSHSDCQAICEFPSASGTTPPASMQMARTDFHVRRIGVEEALAEYRGQLAHNEKQKSRIGDSSSEWQTVREIEATLERIAVAEREGDWMLGDTNEITIENELQTLQDLAVKLPGYLQHNLLDFRFQARAQYRTLIVLTWITTILTGLMLVLLVHLFYAWVFRPLRKLIKGSRRVAEGQFEYRIRLDSHDEMAELAESMNSMTEQFIRIRDDLDSQVKQRTREVIRNEQLASVGFLAAGVSHEINNPLASIALCSEALESRISSANVCDEEDRSEAVHYLRLIQDEAFRCKEITEKLLDFSRMNDIQRLRTDLHELVQGVIEMVGHLGRYREKHVELVCEQAVFTEVCPQEIKQVVLNLLTNALDSISAADPNGKVRVELRTEASQAIIDVTDNGCGMTDDVMEHIFEPFYTNKLKKGQQGTGLGLPISYRIVAEHHGRVEVSSGGTNCGSRFLVRIPLVAPRNADGTSVDGEQPLPLAKSA